MIPTFHSDVKSCVGGGHGQRHSIFRPYFLDGMASISCWSLSSFIQGVQKWNSYFVRVLDIEILTIPRNKLWLAYHKNTVGLMRCENFHEMKNVFPYTSAMWRNPIVANCTKQLLFSRFYNTSDLSKRTQCIYLNNLGEVFVVLCRLLAKFIVYMTLYVASLPLYRSPQHK